MNTYYKQFLQVTLVCKGSFLSICSVSLDALGFLSRREDECDIMVLGEQLGHSTPSPKRDDFCGSRGLWAYAAGELFQTDKLNNWESSNFCSGLGYMSATDTSIFQLNSFQKYRCVCCSVLWNFLLLAGWSLLYPYSFCYDCLCMFLISLL